MDTDKTNNPPSPLGQKGQQIRKIEIQKIRFFVIHLEEGSFETVSPFLIHRCFTNVVGELKSVKKLRSGDLLVEVHNSDQASKIARMYSFKGMPVVVSAHASLNFSRGVVSESELLHVSEEEILSGLTEQHVCGVRRITIRRDGKILPTKHLILTFDSPSLPSHIKAGYLRCPVRPFIPNPLRCFKCQRFGHSKTSCRGSLTCPRCAEVGHDGEGCEATVKCRNCKGDHTAFSRTCPTWLLEKEVQVIKVKEGISYPEARKRVANRTPRSGLSYAAALKSYNTIATQTDAPNIELKLSPNRKQIVSDKPNISKTSLPNGKKSSGKKSASSSPTKSPKNLSVEKPSPLSVKSVIFQKPLNPPLTTSSIKVPRSVKLQSATKHTTHDTSSFTSKHKIGKFDKKKLKTWLKQCEDPPLKLYTTDSEPEDMDEELEVVVSTPPLFAGDTGCGNAQGPA